MEPTVVKINEAYKSLAKFPLKPKPCFKPSLSISSSSKSILNTTTVSKHHPITKFQSFSQISSEKSLLIPTSKRQVNSQYTSAVSDLIFPTTPSTVIDSIPALPKWVKIEIQDYPEVFFLSKNEKTSIDPTLTENEGEMKAVTGDDVAYRYEVLGFLGKGTFGQVVRVFDHKEKVELAMKIVKNKQRYFEQAQLEIEFLRFLKEKHAETKHIVTYTHSFVFRKHMCIAFELLHISVYESLKATNFRGLPFSQIKKISCQALQALAFLASHELIHCDLKPENILLCSSKSTSIKIIDFGSSCFTPQQSFTYIQSRFYRAPEIILGMKYTPAIDIWSLGCILVELYTGIPIFPAENEKDLISSIAEVLGEPESAFIFTGSRSWIYFSGDGHLKVFKNPKGKKRAPGGRSLKSVLKGADDEFVELVSRCLKWDPKERITAEEALKFEWIFEAINVPKVYTRYCKISIEDIIKHNPKLKGLMSHKNKPKVN